MIVQRAVEARLSDKRTSTINFLRDQRNEFACTSPAERETTMEEVTTSDSKGNEHFTDRLLPGHRNWFRQRYLNNVVELQGHNGSTHVMPRTGHIIGSAEGPLFLQSPTTASSLAGGVSLHPAHLH